MRDFTPFVDLQLTFTAGATEVCEPLTVIQDDLVEGDEFFSVTIIRTDFSLGPITSVEITIEDSDRKLATTLSLIVNYCIITMDRTHNWL